MAAVGERSQCGRADHAGRGGRPGQAATGRRGARRPDLRGADQAPGDHHAARALQPGSARGAGGGQRPAARPRGLVRFARMRRAKLISCLTAFTVTLLIVAPEALARQTGGEGFYGETSDKSITNAMFLVIIFFPT